jgi:hypothetical protein
MYRSRREKYEGRKRGREEGEWGGQANSSLL